MNTNSGAAAEIADSHVLGTAGFSWSASTALKGVAVLLMVFHHCYGFPQWFVSPDLIPSVLGGERGRVPAMPKYVWLFLLF